MEIMRWFRLIFLLFICMIVRGFPPTGAVEEQQFTAMYVFGDSSSNPGNNLNFLVTATKSNYYPYGIDFPYGLTGRFSNGKIAMDYIAKLIGVPLLPAYIKTTSTLGESIRFGVNYASAAAGILNENGKNFGHQFNLLEQAENFRCTLNQLRSQMEEEELSKYLANALAFMAIGANDYLNNYLIPLIYESSRLYSLDEFTDILIKQYVTYILELHDLGLRKFYLLAIPPIGCSPIARSIGRVPTGQCISSTNNLVELFNTQFKSLVARHNSDFWDSQFSFGPTFQWFYELHNNPHAYGFKVTDRACCGFRPRNDELLCLPTQMPCSNRDEYVFWDFAHLSQAAHQILVQWAYNGSFYDSFPRNIQEMA